MRLLLNLDVPDLAAAVAFYQQALGFSVGRVLFDGTVVEMLGAAVPLYLPCAADRAGSRCRRSAGR